MKSSGWRISRKIFRPLMELALRYPPEGAYPEVSGGFQIGETLSPSAWDIFVFILGSRGCRVPCHTSALGRLSGSEAV